MTHFLKFYPSTPGWKLGRSKIFKENFTLEKMRQHWKTWKRTARSGIMKIFLSPYLGQFALFFILKNDHPEKMSPDPRSRRKSWVVRQFRENKKFKTLASLGRPNLRRRVLFSIFERWFSSECIIFLWKCYIRLEKFSINQNFAVFFFICVYSTMLFKVNRYSSVMSQCTCSNPSSLALGYSETVRFLGIWNQAKIGRMALRFLAEFSKIFIFEEMKFLKFS